MEPKDSCHETFGANCTCLGKFFHSFWGIYNLFLHDGIKSGVCTRQQHLQSQHTQISFLHVFIAFSHSLVFCEVSNDKKGHKKQSSFLQKKARFKKQSSFLQQKSKILKAKKLLFQEDDGHDSLHVSEGPGFHRGNLHLVYTCNMAEIGFYTYTSVCGCSICVGQPKGGVTHKNAHIRKCVYACV